MTLRPFACLALLLLLVVPSAAASWSVKGAHEPDTSFDTNDRWMFQEPDVAPCLRGTDGCASNEVFFDGFPSYCAPPYGPSCVPTAVSPNAAILGSSVLAYPTVMMAVLGVWKDCNADGAIGLLDQGLVEYRSEVLAQTALAGGPGNSICPVQQTPFQPSTGLPWVGWMPTHNDGQWVRELLPLGNKADRTFSGADVDPWDVEDGAARVWADWGAPSDAPGTDCYLYPIPSGTLRSTGALLSDVDCMDGDHVAPVVQGSPAAPAWSVPDPWGSSTDASDVVLVQCRSGNVTSASPSPGVGTDGSPGGSVGELSAEANCGDDHSAGDAPYLLESSVVDLHGIRVRPDHSLDYIEDARPARPASVVLGAATPGDGGVDAQAQGYWAENAVTGVSRDPFVSRADAGTVAPVTYVTFDAFVSPDAVARYQLSLPNPGVFGTYGAQACGSFTSGVHWGWECDPGAWWPAGDEPLYGVRVEQPFDLQDVDCFDESTGAARENGVSWGTLTGSTCG